MFGYMTCREPVDRGGKLRILTVLDEFTGEGIKKPLEGPCSSSEKRQKLQWRTTDMNAQGRFCPETDAWAVVGDSAFIARQKGR